MKNKYIGLWLLLSVAFLVVLLLAFVNDITIGGYTLKKAPFEDALFGKRESKKDMEAKADSVRMLAQEGNKQKVDSAPQTFLIFGDSMTLNLALRLAQYARQNGHKMHAINWDSSSTIVWANSDTLDVYIKKFEPTYIFISLGANELYLNKPEVRKPQIEKIVEKIGDIPFVWIGPPNWKEDTGFNDLLESILPVGCFFRSAGMDFERKADHIHPTRKSSALWMDSVMRWIPKSAHPILAEIPSDTIGKVDPNVIYLKPKHK